MTIAQNLLPAAAGRRVRFQDLGTRYVIGGGQTGGAFAVVEHDLAPHALGAPLHTHAHEDEISHVTAGRLGVQIGDEVVEAAPGDTVFKPRGVAHAFWNPTDEPLRFLEIITPAGFEGYFAEVEPILGAPGPPDGEAIGAVMLRYGLTMDMESIGRLVVEHGLAAPGGPA